MFENNEWGMISVILADMEQDKWVWIIGILAVLVLAAAAGVVLCRRFRKRYAEDELDEMEGLDFEYYCAELLRNRGFIEVEVTKSSGDYGIDILAEKEGVTYAILCMNACAVLLDKIGRPVKFGAPKKEAAKK